MRKLILCGLVAVGAMYGQGISVGAIGGVPFVDLEKTTTIGGLAYLPKGPNFTVGPTVQINLPLHLRVEFDALARPTSFQVPTLLGVSKTSATEWRFPVIVQYRLGSKAHFFQPFLGVGASFEHLYQIKNAITSGPGTIATNSPGGMLLEGGLDFKAGICRLSAELRYTRQFNASIQNLSELNQAEFLVGARF
jgi:hypothetical protein